MIFALLVLINLHSLGVHSKCNKMSGYDNGLPIGLKKLSRTDQLGHFIIFTHNLFVSNLKSWPEYKSYSCDVHEFKIGSEYLKFSLRPRGCCTLCCQIDKAEDYLTLSFFSRNNTVDLIKLSNKKKAGSLANLGLKNDSKTVLFLHGFSEDGFMGKSVTAITEAYSKKNEDVNLLTLDYSELAAVPWYVEAMDNVPLIAEAVGEFLMFYDKTGEIDIENTHLIGISLGAQLASHIGKVLGKFKKIARITGLDPAFPIYPDNDSSKNIYKGDAKFVDIIHTTSGIYGVRKASGDADFFVEYPSTFIVPRPGCRFFKLALKGEFGEYFFCDHVRGLRMYVQTIANPYLFPVCKRKGFGSEVCGYVGAAADKNSTFGEYHMTTSLSWDPREQVDNVN